MPIRLTKPKTDPVSGLACPFAMADRLHITTIGERSLRFTVYFGVMTDGAFEPLLEGETFAIRNVQAVTASGLDPDGFPTVHEYPADLQFDQMYAAAVAQAAGEFAWQIVSDRAIYPWLMAQACPRSGAKPYEGEVV